MRFLSQMPRMMAGLLATCVSLFSAQSSLAQTAPTPVPTYSVSGANIRANGQNRVWRGANAFHVYSLNSSLMNSWGIDIVREAITYVHIVDLTGGGKAVPGGTGWLQSLQNVATDNAKNQKVTILCPFSWDGSDTQFTGRNPRQTAWWNDYKLKMSAWATQFKSQPNVWIELWNEPYSWNGGNGYTDAMWQQDMAEIVDIIRSAGNNNIIVVPVAGQGGDEGVLTRTNSSAQQYGRLLANKGNIVFDVHAYENWQNVNVDARIQTARSNNYALMIGEVGPYNTSTLMNVNPVLDAARRSGTTTLGWCFDSDDPDRLTTTGDTPNDSNNNNWGSTLRAFTSGSRLANGTYTLAPVCATGSRLDAYNWGTTDGTKVQIWAAGTGTNQKWVLTNLGGGYYKIAPSYSSAVVLDVKAASAVNGAVVQLWTDNGSTAQKWQLIPRSDGSYALHPQCAPNSALDVPGSSSTNGTALQIWSDGGASNQRWIVTPG